MQSRYAFLAIFLFAAAWAYAEDLCPLAESPGSPERIVLVGRHLAAEGSQGLLPGVDDITGYCLSCHDGTVATGIRLGRRDRRLSGVRLHSSHPVDVPYPRNRAGYRNPVQIDSKIPLAGGQVTCVSCHAGDDPSRDFLSVRLTRSRLCLECHIK